jgi:hypothetical protein
LLVTVYECEAFSLIPKKEHSMRYLKKRMLWRVYLDLREGKQYEVGRKEHNEE